MTDCAVLLLFLALHCVIVILKYRWLCDEPCSNASQERISPMETFMKVIAAVLVSTFVFGSAIAQTSDPSSPSPRASAATSDSTTANSDAKRDAAAEKHIGQLHTTLKITPAQEAQWNEVAATMRDNAKEMDRAIDKRAASAASATAVDDLKAYADIAQTHANGVKKLAAAFSGLYSAMSDEQKKAADEAFNHRGHEGKRVASR
jgi:periplasmic protein CpxP/Spy